MTQQMTYPDMSRYTRVQPCWSAAAEPLPAALHPGEEQVRAAVADAMETLRCLGMTGLFPARVRSAHPEIVRQVMESYGHDAEPVRRRPTAREIGRMDRLLPSLMALPVDERMAVTGIGLGLSLRRLGRAMGISYETVRRREREGISALVVALIAGAWWL